QRLADYPGIVPVVDADVDGDPPWMAMRIARTIQETLSDTPGLDVVVRAIRDVAVTLTQLRDEHGLGHRDIHPANLYYYRGFWAVGDFGLVFDPSSPRITEANARWKRARSFSAPEMIDAPGQADPGPADVFSLAKTL